MLRTILILLQLTLAALATWAKTPILGTQEADVERMYQYVLARNPQFDREIAEAFHEVGARYGVRGDIALCQAVIETGWFRFDNGTAVPPEAHNYCGLGVSKRGECGCSFATVREGVTAMIQHLYAYSCRDPLPEGETLADPRFGYVTRGIAPSWESLSGRWAMNKSYGRSILGIYDRMISYEVGNITYESIEVEIPDYFIERSAFLPKEEPAETPEVNFFE